MVSFLYLALGGHLPTSNLSFDHFLPIILSGSVCQLAGHPRFSHRHTLERIEWQARGENYVPDIANLPNVGGLGPCRLRLRGLLGQLDQRENKWLDAHSLPRKREPLDRNIGFVCDDVWWTALDHCSIYTSPDIRF